MRKAQKTKSRKCILISLLGVMICFMVGCGKKDVYVDEWPDSGLATLLPTPDTNKIQLHSDYDDLFTADIGQFSEDDLSNYASKCKEKGFTIDSEEDKDDFSAYNSDGYKVSLSLYNSEMSITVNVPRTNEDLVWPTMGLATLLPLPDADKGSISIDSYMQFVAYVGNMSLDDYNAYVDKCIEIGFNVDYSKGKKVFSAHNSDGTSLRLEYEGFNTMSISMYAAKDDTDSTSESESDVSESTQNDDVMEETVVEEQESSSEDNSNNVDGMRPAFKEAMDSYEAFFDEYCEFMNNYMESDDVLGMLNDYTEYMTQYAETMEKMSAMEQGEMSDAELKYYLEVTERINKKLLGVVM